MENILWETMGISGGGGGWVEKDSTVDEFDCERRERQSQTAPIGFRMWRARTLCGRR